MQFNTVLLSSLAVLGLVQNAMASDKKSSSVTSDSSSTKDHSSSTSASSSDSFSSSKSSKKSSDAAVALNEGAFAGVLGGAVVGALAYLLWKEYSVYLFITVFFLF